MTTRGVPHRTLGKCGVDQLGQLRDAVVLFRSPDVERLVMHELPRRMQHREERPADVLDMYQRSPRGPVALDHDLTRRRGEPDEVVDHQIDAQPR